MFISFNGHTPKAIACHGIKLTCIANCSNLSIPSNRIALYKGRGGKCPETEFTISNDTVYNVHGLIGHCQWTHWTLSMDALDIVHGHLPVQSFQYSSRTMSTYSMDFLQTGKVYFLYSSIANNLFIKQIHV